MGKSDDFDSDDAATGERNYKSSSMRSSTQKTSILKNSSFKKVMLKIKLEQFNLILIELFFFFFQK